MRTTYGMHAEATPPWLRQQVMPRHAGDVMPKHYRCNNQADQSAADAEQPTAQQADEAVKHGRQRTDEDSACR